jgi:hypothetical protein
MAYDKGMGGMAKKPMKKDSKAKPKAGMKKKMAKPMTKGSGKSMGKSMGKGLSDAQKAKLKKEGHSAKHIAKMDMLMKKEGRPMKQAHAMAFKMVGK